MAFMDHFTRDFRAPNNFLLFNMGPTIKNGPHINYTYPSIGEFAICREIPPRHTELINEEFYLRNLFHIISFRSLSAPNKIFDSRIVTYLRYKCGRLQFTALCKMPTALVMY
jgi:hypothetical protein